MRSIRLFAYVLVAASAACASTGATFRSGVGDAFFDHPPYYAGSRAAGRDERIGHVPVTYQRGAVDAPIFDLAAEPGTALHELLVDLNTRLDSIGASVPLRTASKT